MALPAADDFTGTNGDHVEDRTGWTGVTGQIEVQSNQIRGDTFSADGAVYWSSDTFNDDQYAKLLIPTVGSSWLGPMARCDGGTPLNLYAFYVSSDNSDVPYLFKYVAGSWTSLGTGGTISNGEEMEIQCSGTTITPVVDDAEFTDIGAQTDSSHASGSAGIFAFDQFGTIRGDNVEVGNLGGGSQSITAQHIASGEALFSPTVTPGVVNISPGLIASNESVFGPQVDLNIDTGAVATSEAVYSPRVDLAISADTIASAAAVYSPAVTSGTALLPGIIASGEVVYSPQLDLSLDAGTIVTAEAVYDPQLDLHIDAGTVASAESVYDPVVSVGGAQTVVSGLIASGEAVYAPQVDLSIDAQIVASGEAVYSPQVDLDIATGTISSGEAVYSPTVTLILQTISAPLIASGEVVYNPILSGVVTVLPDAYIINVIGEGDIIVESRERDISVDAETLIDVTGEPDIRI